MSDLSRRVSDEEREQTVTSLRDDLVAGRLTVDEFAQRVQLAYQARVAEDLARAREELPAPPLRAPKRRRLSAVVFGHVIRRGRMQLPVRSVGLSAFGDLDLDLREAQVVRF